MVATNPALLKITLNIAITEQSIPQHGIEQAVMMVLELMSLMEVMIILILQDTLVVCQGEFGRTPRINGQSGRDHWPSSWAMMLAGAGIRGGQVIGSTNDDGTQVETQPTRTADLMATIFREAWRVQRAAKDPVHRGLAIGFIAGFIGLLFHAIGANTFIIVRIMEPFWFVTAMVMAIPSLESAKDEAASTGVMATPSIH